LQAVEGYMVAIALHAEYATASIVEPDPTTLFNWLNLISTSTGGDGVKSV